MLARSGADLTGSPSGSTIGTDFSVGVRELVREGFGVGWLPYSMCRADLKSGRMISLKDRYGDIPIDARIFAASGNAFAARLAASITSQEAGTDATQGIDLKA